MATAKLQGSWTPKKKRAMTSLDYHIVLTRLWRYVEGTRVKNVYANRGIYELRLSHVENSIYFWPPYAFFPYKGRLASYEQEAPLLRELRRIKGQIIRTIYQVNMDRVVVTDLGNYAVIFEGVREGNLILTSNKTIIAALNEKKMRDRNILPGAAYVPPPTSSIDPFSITFNDLVDKLHKPTRKSRPAIIRLIRNLSLPAEVASEALYRSRIDFNSTFIEEDECSKLYFNIQNILKEALKGEKGFKAVRGEEVFGVYPFKPQLLAKLGFEVIETDDYPSILGEYFIDLFEETVKEKRDTIVPSIEATAERYLEEAAKLRKIGEVLLSNISYLEKLRKKALEMRVAGASSKEMLASLLEMYPVIKVDKLRKTITVKIKDETLRLKLDESIGRQASEFFGKAKKLEEKAEKARRVAEKLLEQKAEKQKKKVFKISKKRSWFSHYHHFVSSEGFLVVGGRDASQNETLVKKYLTPKDIFLHAEIHGGPVVIIKTEGKAPGEETIYEAGQLAAAFSRAWEAGFASIDVYWVYGSQVSKKAPSGEYLSRGAFMVYGSRNYLRNIPLEWGVGLKIERDVCELVCAPPSVVEKQCNFWAVLVPGRLRREFVVKKLIKHFTDSAREMGIKVKLSSEEIIMCLPKGGFYILRWGKRV